MCTTNFYKSFSENTLLYMSIRLSIIRSEHTYVMPRTVYFGCSCIRSPWNISKPKPKSKYLLKSTHFPTFSSKTGYSLHKSIGREFLLAFHGLTPYISIGYQFWLTTNFYSFKPYCLKLVDIFDSPKAFWDWSKIFRASKTGVYTIVNYGVCK